MTPEDRTARRFFVVLLVASTVLLAIVIRPLASALLMAAVLAGVIWPLHARLAAKTRVRRALSAGLLVLSVAIVFVGPVVALLAFLLKEGDEGLKFVSQMVRGDRVGRVLSKLPESLASVAGEALARLSDIDQVLGKVLRAQGGKAAATIWAAASATGPMLFGAVMMPIALYFFLVQGDELLSWLDEASPLRPGQTRELFAEFKKVSFSVIVSAGERIANKGGRSGGSGPMLPGHGQKPRWTHPDCRDVVGQPAGLCRR